MDIEYGDDLLVVSRFKNLRLHKLLHGKPMHEWTQIFGVSADTLYKALSLRVSPFSLRNTDALNRKLKPWAERIAISLGVDADWLFPESLYSLNLPDSIERTYESPTILRLQEARGLLPAVTYDISRADLPGLQAQLTECLRSLTPREEKVLTMRFGLCGEREHTLEEIGFHFGISRGRIKQIENKALRKMRHPSRAKHIEPYTITAADEEFAKSPLCGIEKGAFFSSKARKERTTTRCNHIKAAALARLLVLKRATLQSEKASE